MLKFKHAIVQNLPNNPKEILDYALSKCYKSWVDEKGTKDHPGVWQRRPSKLSYEEAFKIIQPNNPHWVVSFRNDSYFGQEDYWEFGGSNIGGSDYGDVYIWICVDVGVALEIFKKYKLKVKEY